MLYKLALVLVGIIYAMLTFMVVDHGLPALIAISTGIAVTILAVCVSLGE